MAKSDTETKHAHVVQFSDDAAGLTAIGKTQAFDSPPESGSKSAINQEQAVLALMGQRFKKKGSTITHGKHEEEDD
ncbi:hypothetical protein QQZ08_000349 [Neonectria magnoliae]|uniref:Uncharacterized protein n=1 Tax=Neonectria magnoliae TaxID=2732573 RepID=A0ABR1IH16_9HYPO